MSTMSGIRQSQTSPSYLHANSTSHTWPFSAIAELIDNAYDPDVAASLLYIDIEDKCKEKCLTFTDNGKGCSLDKLHKMLSFGFCEKVEVNGHKPIGHYGNGFKSGSMRLGKDAIVLSKTTDMFTVGFLSQTYLEKIGSKTVLVPMACWDKNKKLSGDSAEENLAAITSYSIFNNERELLNEFGDLDMFSSGTKIIIYNLKRGSDSKYELDLESCSNDIRNSERQELDFSTTMRPVVQEYVAEYRKSLREYCSILFLKPRMKIVLRGHKVKTKLISKSLSRTEKDYYKPVYLSKPCKIIFGFSQSVEDFGVMMYHKNRLIKAYEHVGCQKQHNDHGVGIVSVVELDFLEPVHNKQDFNKTDRYNACINALGQKLSDYWYTKTQTGDALEQRKKADWTWVQCENCLKWRRLPDGFTDEGLPDKWFCYMNPDPTHNRCDIDEEPEDEDELQAKASYNKVKKKPEPKKVEVGMHQPLSNSTMTGVPTVGDYVQAQKALELARKKELEQQQYIQQLKENPQRIQYAQNLMRSSQNNNLNVLNNIAKSGTMNSRAASNILNGKKRKERISIPGGDIIVTKNETSSDEEPNDVKIITVKLPVRKKVKKSSDVIVIDSAEESSEEERVESKKKVKREPASEKKSPAKNNPNKNKVVKSSKVHKGIQTDTGDENMRKKLEESQEKLKELRSNVGQLLKTILPDLEIDNLLYIDAIVGEMIKVNGDETTANGEQSTGNAEKAMVNGEETAANGEEAMVNGEETAANGEETTANGVETTANGVEITANGEETTANGENLNGVSLSPKQTKVSAKQTKVKSNQAEVKANQAEVKAEL